MSEAFECDECRSLFSGFPEMSIQYHSGLTGQVEEENNYCHECSKKMFFEGNDKS